jgi:hypothetical protein
MEAIFTKGVEVINISGLMQWDVGQEVKISFPSMPATFQVHFGHKKAKEAYAVEAITQNGSAIVQIPNILLQQPHDIIAWVYVSSGMCCETTHIINFDVEARPRPSDYAYKETDILNYATVIEKSQEIAAIAARAEVAEACNETLESAKSYTDTEIAVERERINALTTLKEGSTTGDAELIDARIDKSGNTHANVGTHIRTVTSQLSSEIENVKSELKDDLSEISSFGYQYIDRSMSQFGKVYYEALSPTEIGGNEYYILPNFVVPPGTYYFNDIRLAKPFCFIFVIDGSRTISLNDLYDEETKSLTLEKESRICLTFISDGLVSNDMMCDIDTIPNSYKFGKYATLPIEIEDIKREIVECGTGKQFTRLRDAIEYGTKYYNSKVIVYPGTYDLTQEFSTEIEQASGECGIALYNDIEIEFLAGSYVKAIFDDFNAWAYSYFQPFYSHFGWSFTLNGLNIETKNTRYCVHDEHGGVGSYYHKFINCIMENTTSYDGNDVFFPQCIGGGLGEHGYIDIIGGKYTSNNLISSNENENLETISYHNGINASCDGRIFIKDIYVSGRLQFGSYGNSTIKSKILVNGCSMGSPITISPKSDGTYNYELTEWNNIIRQ